MKFLGFSIFLLGLSLSACNEAPLIDSDEIDRINRPLSMVLIPGTPYGVIANANIQLEERHGSLLAIDLDQRVVIKESAIAIPNFAGRMFIDVTRSRIYVADRGDDAVLVYSYSIPGVDGSPISFAEIPSEVPAEKQGVVVENGVETDEDPFDVLGVTTPSGEKIFSTNSVSGSVSVFGPDLAPPADLDPDDGKLEGLPLISAANFESKDKRPGKGANRMVLAPDGRLIYITSTQNTALYVVDAFDDNVEAMIDLSPLASSNDTRGIAVSTSNVAFIAHRGLGAVLILDVSEISNNGIDMEVVDPKLLDIAPVGRNPEGIALSTDELRMFVSVQGEGRVDMIDSTTHAILVSTLVGIEPTEVVLDSSRAVVYVLNVQSNSISILDETTGALLETIE